MKENREVDEEIIKINLELDDLERKLIDGKLPTFQGSKLAEKHSELVSKLGFLYQKKNAVATKSYRSIKN